MSFTMIPDAIIDRNDLSPFELACAVFIARKTMGWGKQTDGISLSQFVAGVGASKPTVIKALKGLCDKEIILKTENFTEKGGQSFNSYSFTSAVIDEANKGRNLAEKEGSPCKSTLQPPVNHVDSPCKSPLQGPVKDVYTQDKPNTRKTRQEKKTSKKGKPFALPDFVNPDAWRDFEEHRRFIGARLSDKARSLAANKLKGFSHEEQQAAVNAAIEGGWKTIYPKRLQPAAGQKDAASNTDQRRHDWARQMAEKHNAQEAQNAR